MNIQIGKMRSAKDRELCAKWQAESDPWKTLGATFERCLQGFYDRSKNIFIIRDNKTPIGFLILIKQGVLRGYIATIFIHPDWQGKGAGTEVMKFAEDELFREFQNVFLCVSSFNEKAQTLYSRLGYERIGMLKDFFVKGHDEIIMRKTRGPIISS